ncbi:putative alcohol oxidase [Nemania sp. FL0031]|nr:putative alcohol oxidase [Nemania sp. FL0031]
MAYGVFLACFLLLILPAVASPASSNGHSCRCFPGDTCWPAKSAWDDFNKTVNGRLVATIPLGAVCHGLTYNQNACGNLTAVWHNPDTHFKTSSSIMAPFFANNSCDPFAPRDSPCVVGAYVRYAVDARSASHYQAAIKFATKHNIRLVVRNTGHDWLGKSTGAGALAIWTHNFKGTQTLHYDSSYYTGPALKLNAGTQLIEAYQAAHEKGLIVVGGTCPSVGIAGGYTQGTGHGLSVSKFGLGADQALEWEVVTVDGVVRKASPNVNPDLYWALSGGGGGTYGVVVSLTVRAYQDRRTAAANMTFSKEGVTEDVFYQGIQSYVAGLPAVLDAGATSTWINTNDIFVLSPAVGPGMSKDDIDALHRPVLNKLKKLNISYDYYSAEFPTYLDMFEAMNPFTETAEYQIGSRLIPRSVILDNSSGFTSALREICSKNGGTISGVSFNVSRASPVPNAVNPAFRKASVSLVVGTVYDYHDLSKNIANQKLMTDVIVPKLARLIPGGGSAYLNEGDPWEPSWQKVFYGQNYDRLLKIKNKYDPERVLYALTGVGSEAWAERTDGRLCRT